jgi:hypothetical protein
MVDEKREADFFFFFEISGSFLFACLSAASLKHIVLSAAHNTHFRHVHHRSSCRARGLSSFLDVRRRFCSLFLMFSVVASLLLMLLSMSDCWRHPPTSLGHTLVCRCPHLLWCAVFFSSPQLLCPPSAFHYEVRVWWTAAMLFGLKAASDVSLSLSLEGVTPSSVHLVYVLWQMQLRALFFSVREGTTASRECSDGERDMFDLTAVRQHSTSATELMLFLSSLKAPLVLSARMALDGPHITTTAGNACTPL